MRTTVRNLQREGDVRSMLKTPARTPVTGCRSSRPISKATRAGPKPPPAANTCCTSPSPIPVAVPKNEDELIVPAREGALRVLRAARDARVKRVVLTSSFAAIGYGLKPQTAPFDENSWTDINGYGATPYIKSKTIAERAAWDFVAQGSLELAVVNPVAILGPVLGPDYSPSIMIVQRMMDGAIPGCPQRWFGIVDVRDVADLHVRAMTHPAARGERFLCTAGDFMSMLEIAKVLKARMGAAGAKVPARSCPTGSCASRRCATRR